MDRYAAADMSLRARMAREAAHQGTIDARAVRVNILRRMSGWDPRSAPILSDPCRNPACPVCGYLGDVFADELIR